VGARLIDDQTVKVLGALVMNFAKNVVVVEAPREVLPGHLPVSPAR